MAFLPLTTHRRRWGGGGGGGGGGQAYGMTEHSCITLTHGNPALGRATAKRNSVGFVLPNLEVKFVDPDTGRSLPRNAPGELCVRSQCVMQGTPPGGRKDGGGVLLSPPLSAAALTINVRSSLVVWGLPESAGYHKNKEETERTVDSGGWLHTGDVGYIDDDGDVFIVDRIKELIKYKGFQVRRSSHRTTQIHPPGEDKSPLGAAPCGPRLCRTAAEVADQCDLVITALPLFPFLLSLAFNSFPGGGIQMPLSHPVIEDHAGGQCTQ